MPHLPYPHFMGLAPLEVWARLLLRSPGPVRIAPRYWPRLLAALGASIVGTAITLPERLLLAPFLHSEFRRTDGTLDHAPGVVIVLGHFRSGTTHLHYLLGCDPRFATPRWHQVLAPHGFVAAWLFLRAFLVPFLGNCRPQDDVAFGPEWPAEDDFATCNAAGASSLPGRVVLPRQHAHFHRFHALVDLSDAERQRWRFAQWSFTWRLAVLARGRRLLLKTPSHTARVPELLWMFGRDRVKFVHISREPREVIRSNLAMIERLGARYGLQGLPHPRILERRVIDEFVESETRYLSDRAKIPPGDLAELRFEDLRADPVGELRRVHRELGLEWTRDYEARLLAYLDAVGDYEPTTTVDAAARMGGSMDERLNRLRVEFGHDRPPVPRRSHREALTDAGRSERFRSPIAVALGAALVTTGCVAGWTGLAALARNRYDIFVWPVGIVVGLATLRLARAGSARWGIYAAALTLLAFVAAAFPNTRVTTYARREAVPWEEWWASTSHEMFAGPTLFWLAMALATAYRLASRKHVRPPGAI